MKMRKILSGLMCAVMLAGQGVVSYADSAMVDEYSLSFNGRPAVNRLVTASTLDAEIVAKYGMGSSDVVGSDENGTPYVAHMANNSYVWTKQADGNYITTLGGVDGYYGFFREAASSADFKVTSANKDYMSVLNLAGNVLQIKPYGNGGYNCYGSFGKYDLDISGVTEFRSVILPMNMQGGKMVTELALVQGKADVGDSCSAEYKYLIIDENNNVIFDDQAESVATLTPYSSWSQTPVFYEVIYTIDNRTADIKHSLKILNTSTNEVVAYIPMAEMNQEYTIDNNAAAGHRIKASSANGWTGDKRLFVKSISMSKMPALVKSFDERFATGVYGWSDSITLANTLDSAILSQYGMNSGDIIADKNGNEYKASAANNMYVWKKNADESYEKKYCGIPGFYGFINHKSTANLNSSFANYLSVVNTGSDGVLGMTSVGNSGYNQYTSFGKYDLDLSGKSVLTAKIGLIGGTPGTVTLDLVQGKNADNDSVTNSMNILKIKSNDIYFAGSESKIASLEAMSFSNVSNKEKMLTVKYYLDNKGTEAWHYVEIYNANGKMIAATQNQKIDSSYGNYNFTELGGGIKFKAELSGRWDTNHRFLIDDIAFANGAVEESKKDKIYSENLTIVNEAESKKTVSVIAAAYNSENKLIDVAVSEIELEAGEKAFCDNVLLTLPAKDEYSVQTMFWETLENMKPIECTDALDEYGYRVITLK